MCGLRDPDFSAGQKNGVLSMRNRKHGESRLIGISHLEELKRGSRGDLIYGVGAKNKPLEVWGLCMPQAGHQVRCPTVSLG